MKKRILALVLFGLVLTLVTGAAVYAGRREYRLPLRDGVPSRIEMSREGIAETGEEERALHFYATRPGDVTVRAFYPGNTQAEEIHLHVGENLHLSAGSGRFSGDRQIIFSVTLMLLAITGVSLYTSVEAHVKKTFSYAMAGADTVTLMLGFQSVMLLYALLTTLDRSLSGFFATLHALGSRFADLTAPLMGILALWLFVSNLWLIRKEGFSWRNMLGVGLGTLWSCAYILHVFLSRAGDGMLAGVLQTVVDYTLVYFECVLLALSFCGIRAARHVPDYGKDVIMILGCMLRRDGTPTPLLQGRLNRAMAFERDQFIQTGKHAVFMPSGGQGKNGEITEAHAMSLYLQSRGIPQKRIVEEDRSHNTFQNMLFSKRLISQIFPGARVAFSTTGYHVFRSMLLATRVGLEAEGMGSRTKWYYYPNAYLREILGLVYAHQSVLWCFLLVVGIYLGFGLLAQIG
ncbi:MAG: YdcF family protein [Clostridia bacterium]|nr:YdcF family protein [Clostridia bacterium]